MIMKVLGDRKYSANEFLLSFKDVSLRRRLFRAVEKWESCSWISTFPPPFQVFFVFPGSHFHLQTAGAVKMWESRRPCEISKELWKGWETCFWFSRLSTAPPFAQLSEDLLPVLTISAARPQSPYRFAATRTWLCSSCAHTRYRSCASQSDPNSPN